MDSGARQRQALQPGFRPIKTAFDVAQQGLDEIAASTGGAFVATTQVSSGLRESVKLAEGGYYIGFYAKDDEAMTQKRIERMKLRTTRNGITLKHRRAYEGARKADDAAAKKIRGIIPGRVRGAGVSGRARQHPPAPPRPRPARPRIQGDRGAGRDRVHVHLRLATPKGVARGQLSRPQAHLCARHVKSGQFDPPELRAWADLPDGDYFAEAIVTVPGSTAAHDPQAHRREGNRAAADGHVVS
jgi:hypothetical protein